MTKKNAISILEKQKATLNEKDIILDLWLIQTESYIRKFFPKKSGQIKIINNQISPKIPEADYDKKLEVFKTRMSFFLTHCIDVINDIGTEIPYTNFLYRINNSWLTLIFTLAINIIFWIGYYFEKKTSDTQNFMLSRQVTENNNQIKVLKDSIVMLNTMMHQ